MEISKLRKVLIGVQQVVEKHSPDQYALIEETINEIDSKPDDVVLEEFNELVQKLQQAAGDRDFAAYQTAALMVIRKYNDHSELHEIASDRVERIRKAYGFNNDSVTINRNMSAAISDNDYETARLELQNLKKVYADYRYQFPDTLKQLESDLMSQPSVQVADRFNRLLRVFNERPNIDTARQIIDVAESDEVIKDTYDLSQVEEYIADSDVLQTSMNELRRLQRGE